MTTHTARVGGGRLGALFSSLLATQVVVSLLGFVFWGWAARAIPATEVGFAAAAISAMTFVSTFAMLGVGTLLISEMPRRAVAAVPALVTTGLIAVALTGLVIGVVVGVLGPVFGSSLRLTADLPWGLTAFALGTAAMATGAVFDDVVLGLGKGRLQLLRNSFASVLRIAAIGLIVVAGMRTADALVVSWTGSILLSLVVSIAGMRLSRLGRWRVPLSVRLGDLRANLAQARSHHTLNLILQSSAYLLPVLAAIIAAPADVAYFNSARLISGAVLTVPFILTIALFASTSADASLVGARVRRTVPMGLGLSTLCVIGTFVAGPTIMRVFGETYGSEGTIYLKLLVLGGPLLVIKDHYVAIQRIRGELGAAARWITAGTVVEMAAALAGGFAHGLKGLCVGWLIGLGIEALAMAPRIVKVVRAV